MGGQAANSGCAFTDAPCGNKYSSPGAPTFYVQGTTTTVVLQKNL